MNETAKKFFLKHKIPVDLLERQKESHIWKSKEIDKIVADYGFSGKYQESYISIADVIGYDACQNNASNIFHSFDQLFDEFGDGYHSRSCGLLDIPSSCIMDVLSESFIKEPMVIRQIHDDHNIIYINGLHRYTVLRTHFLNETFGLVPTTAEFEKVKAKYTIPVEIKKVDLLKTYCNYLLSNHPNLRIHLCTELDDDFHPTGNLVLTLPSGQTRILNNDQLIQFTRLAVLSSMNSLDYAEMISISQQSNPYFARYIETYIPELVPKLDKKK